MQSCNCISEYNFVSIKMQVPNFNLPHLIRLTLVIMLSHTHNYICIPIYFFFHISHYKKQKNQRKKNPKNLFVFISVLIFCNRFTKFSINKYKGNKKQCCSFISFCFIFSSIALQTGKIADGHIFVRFIPITYHIIGR